MKTTKKTILGLLLSLLSISYYSQTDSIYIKKIIDSMDDKVYLTERKTPILLR